MRERERAGEDREERDEREREDDMI